MLGRYLGPALFRLFAGALLAALALENAALLDPTLGSRLVPIPAATPSERMTQDTGRELAPVVCWVCGTTYAFLGLVAAYRRGRRG